MCSFHCWWTYPCHLERSLIKTFWFTLTFLFFWLHVTLAQSLSQYQIDSIFVLFRKITKYLSTEILNSPTLSLLQNRKIKHPFSQIFCLNNILLFTLFRYFIKDPNRNCKSFFSFHYSCGQTAMKSPSWLWAMLSCSQNEISYSRWFV